MGTKLRMAGAPIACSPRSRVVCCTMSATMVRASRPRNWPSGLIMIRCAKVRGTSSRLVGHDIVAPTQGGEGLCPLVEGQRAARAGAGGQVGMGAGGADDGEDVAFQRFVQMDVGDEVVQRRERAAVHDPADPLNRMLFAQVTEEKQFVSPPDNPGSSGSGSGRAAPRAAGTCPRGRSGSAWRSPGTAAAGRTSARRP